MLDLETFSTSNNALIVSIGLVSFDMEGIIDKQLIIIDMEDSNCKHFDIDPMTVKWWFEQNKSAREHLFLQEMPLREGLRSVNEFIRGSQGVWGNSSTFDNVILRNAMNQLHITPSWSFRKDSCYRTIKSLCPDVFYEVVGTRHNPMNDAESQALHLIKVINKLGVIL
jgi:hypothetical protein